MARSDVNFDSVDILALFACEALCMSSRVCQESFQFFVLQISIKNTTKKILEFWEACGEKALIWKIRFVCF